VVVGLKLKQGARICPLFSFGGKMNRSKDEKPIFFPIRGIHKGYPTSLQPDGTTFDCNNMRPSASGRMQGVQRPALSKWSTDQVGAAEQPVVAMCTVSSIA
jgi:hypothetical protein